MIVVTVARKPLAEGSVASNVLTHSAGALHIDATRIATFKGSSGHPGRWPANLVLGHLGGCRLTGTRKVKGTGPGHGGGFKDGKFSGQVGDGEYTRTTFAGFADGDGLETVEAWECEAGCPVRDMDTQSGIQKSGVAIQRHGGGQALFGGIADGKNARGAQPDVGYGDVGGASRFFKQVGGQRR